MERVIDCEYEQRRVRDLMDDLEERGAATTGIFVTKREV